LEPGCSLIFFGLVINTHERESWSRRVHVSQNRPPRAKEKSSIDLSHISARRKLNRRLIYECRCDERLKGKTEGCIRLVYTRLYGGLEHLKIKTRLIDERFLRV
jgi:hypothetical protein